MASVKQLIEGLQRIKDTAPYGYFQYNAPDGVIGDGGKLRVYPYNGHNMSPQIMGEMKKNGWTRFESQEGNGPCWELEVT